MLVKVCSLSLTLNHIQHFPVVCARCYIYMTDRPHPPVIPRTYGTLVLKLVVEAVLVERVFAQEVNSREGQATLA